MMVVGLLVDMVVKGKRDEVGNRFLNKYCEVGQGGLLCMYLKAFSLSLALIFLCTSLVLAQEDSKTIISFSNKCIYIGLTNSFRIVVQQDGPVKLNQLEATLKTHGDETGELSVSLEIKQNGEVFSIHPEILGDVNILVRTLDGTEEIYTFRARPIPAVARIGNWGPRTKGQMPTNVFKAQSGVYALVENLDISARCYVVSYEVIRISPGKDAEAIVNQGGKWQLEATELIRKAKPGDRYVFTDIKYRCPGTQVVQSAETLSFELR